MTHPSPGRLAPPSRFIGPSPSSLTSPRSD